MNVKHIIACDRDLRTPASHLNQQFCLALGSESEIESYSNWTAFVEGVARFWWLLTFESLLLGRRVD